MAKVLRKFSLHFTADKGQESGKEQEILNGNTKNDSFKPALKVPLENNESLYNIIHLQIVSYLSTEEIHFI